MDINDDYNHPKAKKWHFWQYNKKINPFPVTSIDDSNPKFTGNFTGLSVEIFDEAEIFTIYDNGCYGVGSRTKSTPRVFYAANAPKRPLADAEDTHEHKKVTSDEVIDNSKWADDADKPTNMKTSPLPKDIPINRIPPIGECSLNFTESLNLYPEEAFFLHYSLKCLSVVDFFSKVELSTDDLLQRFCRINSNFITHFVAYHYFRSQNWVVKCGLKYGGHFLLYYKGPQFYHASYIVLVQAYNEHNEHLMECKDLQGLYRLGETCKKDILIIQVKYPPNLTAADGMNCLMDLSKFQVMEMSPKRFIWNHGDTKQ